MLDPVRKLPREIDSPVDNYLLDVVQVTVAFYRRLGLTPNGVTTLSLIAGIISAYLLQRGAFLWASASYLVSYYYDCMDGYMARKYKLSSNIGDIYDHIKDYIVGAAIIYFLFERYRAEGPIVYTLLLIPILLLTSSVHIGCQEVYCRKRDHSILLSLFTNVSFANGRESAGKHMRVTRYFATGSVTLAICMLIAALRWLR